MTDPNLLKQLLQKVADQGSLTDLLKTREESGGLGWPVDIELPFQLEPEIAAGVKGDGQVTVSRLIPAASDENQLVLLAEFERPYVRRDLRELLSSVRRHIRTTGRFEDHTGLGDTLFIVAAPGYDDVRFVLFEERQGRQPRIRSFGWRKEFIGRTVLTHNLGRLRWRNRLQWEKAWDVEGLTDEFYNEFVKVFDAVKAVTTHPGTEENKHAYVQQLLNRLLFIAFIERMGWLKTPEGSSDYLHAQWLRFRHRDHYKEVKDKSLIPATFNGLLGWLFFRALDAPNGVKSGDQLYPILGEVPYLNGGLFSEEADLDVSGVTVADEVFDLILGDRRPGFEGGLFRRFNFTVTESTPLDQEVAVDPEMLGKIFERIIIAEERHRTGTYYTPRPIVEFMVNEALKGYLTERGLAADKAAILVDNDTVESASLSFKPSEMQDTLDWLFEVRAVDPACGSGAYLLMLLQRLFELADRLEVVRNKRRDPDQRHLYNTKLRLLARCIYGVDISEIAVRIARLRLWLSLVVENRGEKPEPLPNFDFLIMYGDSLASPIKPDQRMLGYPHDAIREYTRLKRRYFHPVGGENLPTREQMQTNRAEIAVFFDDELASSRLRSLSRNPFDWEVEFAEVFDPQESEETVGGSLNLGSAAGRKGQGELPAQATRAPGFDIVLANPPYVNAGELLRNVGAPYKSALVAAYPTTGSGTADLLIFFMDRALSLLRPGGHLAFITSNRWLRAAYGQKLRSHLARVAHVRDLIDFRDLPVFQNVIAYPLITLASRSTNTGKTRFVSVPSLSAPYPDVAALVMEHGVELSQNALNPEGNWRLDVGELADRLTRMRERGIPLGEYVKNRIYYGIKTGLNEVKIGDDGRMYGKIVPREVRVMRKEGVFVIDSAKRAELIAADSKSDEIIKPLAIGRDIKKWVVEGKSRWLIVTKIGTDMNRYPAIMRHLEKYKEKLLPRADQGEHWWELRACAYYNVFDKGKILYQEIAGTPSFAFNAEPLLFTNKVFVIPLEDHYLLGLLNSRLALDFWRSISSLMVGGALAMQTPTVFQLPVIEPSIEDRQAITSAVRHILDRKTVDHNSDVSELETEINRRVEFLYFHADEAPTYDEWVIKKEAERGTVIEEIRKLSVSREKKTVERKQSLEYVDPNHPDLLKIPDENRRREQQSQNRKAVIHSALKTVCAFLNSQGGTLLLGVHDKGDIIGIEPDFILLGRKQDVDGFELKLTDLLKTRIRPIPANLEVDFVVVDGKTVCRIDVPADPRPHYLDNRLYIRLGNSTEELTGRDLEDWLRQRRD